MSRSTNLTGVSSVLAQAQSWLSTHPDSLSRWRRTLHAHPEVAYTEHQTTSLIMRVLQEAGLSPKRLALGTGVVCDIGPGPSYVALRADIDALPLPDSKAVPYASQVPGVCHACGHDAHTAILLGVASVLSDLAELPRSVRLIFQPAEERMPGGAMAVVDEGWLDGVEEIFALHCDPKLDAGQVGLRAGAITAAFDQLEVALSGPGGHTARPQLTADLVYALGSVITQLPGLLARRVDPRSALSLVWGAVQAGSAANAIPQDGVVRGTVRMLDGDLWDTVEPTITDLVRQIVAPTGASVEVTYTRGVPAVMNNAALVAVQTRAALAALGAAGVADTVQSMGGEDFAWYLRTVPGSMARLGVRHAGTEGGDLHQPSFDIDESALPVGVAFTCAILDELALG